MHSNKTRPLIKPAKCKKNYCGGFFNTIKSLIIEARMLFLFPEQEGNIFAKSRGNYSRKYGIYIFSMRTFLKIVHERAFSTSLNLCFATRQSV